MNFIVILNMSLSRWDSHLRHLQWTKINIKPTVDRNGQTLRMLCRSSARSVYHLFSLSKQTFSPKYRRLRNPTGSNPPRIMRWKLSSTCCINISRLKSGWSAIGTGRTVHGACLTFALCFWVDERPYDLISSVGFVIQHEVCTTSNSFESAQLFTSVFTTKIQR